MMGKVNILLAEDDLFIQKMLITIMNYPDYIIDLADDGNKVVEKANLNKYDIIFMDFFMPGLNGIEATRAIRHSGNNTPIIGLSAHHNKDEIKKCLQAGMNDFMVKPVFKDDIVKMMNVYVGNTSGKDDKNNSKIIEKNSEKFAFIDKLNNKSKIDLLNDFIKYIPEQIKILSDLVDQRKYKELSLNAHRFKGSFFSMGSDKLNEILKNIEINANEQCGDFSILLVEMKSELDVILKELNDYLYSLKNN
jgi:CheY-like chemotaxis protein